MAKFEGAIVIDDEKESCSRKGCKEKVVGATVVESKIKGLTVDEYHYWCKKHYIEVIKDDGGLRAY